MADVRVATIGRDDLPRVVELHRKAFPKGAISELGHEAVLRYYAWLHDGPHDARITGAWLDDELVGFCAAGVFRGAMNGFLRRNRRFLAAHILRHPQLLLSSLIRDRIATAARVTLRFSRARQVITQPSPPPTFGVLAIATSPHVRGSGAGRALMTEAEDRARRAGYSRMVLTVHPDNVRAVRFYEELGWQRYIDDGAWTGVMEKQID